MGIYRRRDRPCRIWRSGDGLGALTAAAGRGCASERSGNLLRGGDFLSGGGDGDRMDHPAGACLFGYSDWNIFGGFAGVGILGAGGVHASAQRHAADSVERLSAGSEQPSQRRDDGGSAYVRGRAGRDGDDAEGNRLILLRCEDGRGERGEGWRSPLRDDLAGGDNNSAGDAIDGVALGGGPAGLAGGGRIANQPEDERGGCGGDCSWIAGGGG